MVGLRDTRSGVHQIFGPARVVRQKKQTLARLIQPPDWRDKRPILPQTIIDRFPLLWIAARGPQAPWLVQNERDPAPCADRTAVDRDVCKREIHQPARGMGSAPPYRTPAHPPPGEGLCKLRENQR